MKVWFTSDCHFGHARINELASRPFATTEECDAAMIDRWNSTIGDDDAVYILGDLAMGKLPESLAKVAQLRGKKFLVPGNHDRVSSLYRGSPEKKAEWAKAYADAGLLVTDEEFHLSINGIPVMVSHFPYEGDSHDEDRYQWSRPRDTGDWLLHGHVHEQWKVKGRQINVGVDVWDFTPVSEEQIAEIIFAPAS